MDASRFLFASDRECGQVGCSRKNDTSRSGNQSKRPGNGVDMNPAWPPVAGLSRTTAWLTSFAAGSDDAGMNGSFIAFSTSVGTAIDVSQGLLLARRQ